MTRGQSFRARYGAHPLHLAGLLASFAITGLAVAGWLQRAGEVSGVLEWFAAAIVLHDLVFLPLYSLVDRVVFRGGAHRRPRLRTSYVRIPALLSALLLLVFLPTIFGLGSRTERFASGITEHGYLGRWLIATAALFTASGLTFAVASLRRRAVRQRATARERTRPSPHRTPPGR